MGRQEYTGLEIKHERGDGKEIETKKKDDQANKVQILILQKLVMSFQENTAKKRKYLPPG